MQTRNKQHNNATRDTEVMCLASGGNEPNLVRGQYTTPKERTEERERREKANKMRQQVSEMREKAVI